MELLGIYLPVGLPSSTSDVFQAPPPTTSKLDQQRLPSSTNDVRNLGPRLGGREREFRVQRAR